MSLAIDYSPVADLARNGSTVQLQYAPSPLPMTLNVNLLALFSASGNPIPAFVTDYINSTTNGSSAWTISVPVADTPIGSFTIASYDLFEGLAYLDIDIAGQLQASVTSSAGSLSRNSLTWGTWGGQSTTLTVAGTSNITVDAAFEYAVSNAYSIRFVEPIASALVSMGYPATFTVASFTLGTFPLQGSAHSAIEVVQPQTVKIVQQAAPDQPALIAGVGVVCLAAGSAAGLVVGRRKKN